MANKTLNPDPSLAAISRAQFRMLVHLQRRDFVILGILVVMMVGLALWGQTTQVDADSAGDDTLQIFRGLAILFGLAGAFWPLGVWRADSPAQRGYFWALPVERRRHTLIRLAAGWVVLVAVTAIIMAIAVLAMVPTELRYEGSQLDLGGAWQPFAAATLAYVIVSALAVLFENPFRWIAYLWLGVLGLYVVGEAAEMEGLSEWVEDAVGSLFVAFGGTLMEENESVAGWSRHYLIWLAVGSAALVSALLWRHEER